MTNTKTKFNKLKDLLNNTGVGNTITRQQLVSCIEEKLKEDYTTDHYRRRFQLGGYISTVSLNLYKVEKVIPEDFTLQKLNREIEGRPPLMGTFKVKDMFNYLILIFTLIGCNQTNDPPLYPPELKPYVIEFEAYAHKNHYPFDWEGLVIYLRSKETIPEPQYAAYYKPKEHAIYIDTTTWLWEHSRAETIYHELGHAICKRDHTFERLGNTMLYKSLMGNNAIPQFSNNPERKDYYLTELFKPNTPTPYWALK